MIRAYAEFLVMLGAPDGTRLVHIIAACSGLGGPDWTGLSVQPGTSSFGRSAREEWGTVARQRGAQMVLSAFAPVARSRRKLGSV